MKIIIISSTKTFRRLSCLILIPLLIFKTVNSQTIIPANNVAQAELLVPAVLFGTGIRIVPGSTIYSGQFIGNTGGQIGSFHGFGAPNTNLGISSGIIMSNGNVTRANQPNTSTSEYNYYDYYCECEVFKGDPDCINQTNPACWNGDVDLDAILGCSPSCTFDAVSLQFKLIPSSNIVNFNYVFASDEYPNNINSPSVDLFRILVTGNNPHGGSYNKQNMTLVPNTNEAVGINTINSKVNSQYYVNNANGKTIVYNAFTTVLTATLLVIPCDTYLIKIALADVGDGAFDSSLFLQAASFTVMPPNITFQKRKLDSIAAIKGCSDAIIKFETANGMGTQADSIINISLGGTALYGNDYTTIPPGIKTSITIAKGNNLKFKI